MSFSDKSTKKLRNSRVRFKLHANDISDRQYDLDGKKNMQLCEAVLAQ